ncbi:polymer-forming cytoskeletal protein [Lewinella sp. JB7]|uniref:bactofilin family protein n=1 Tax=Lewinella sp. JB7 TaxID=2962887 RepID=UPI0020C9C5ED|nr:polymer-forming cytoskeletal protein [Lewinella sp. JB7]MCP9235644.1 polymer-forming cytoskeletal protein [Lewinella sp. JB7]
MFGRKRNKRSSVDERAGKTTETAAPAEFNAIGEHTTIDGNFTAAGDIRIDGTVTGDVICGARLIIGPRGTVTGNIECVNASIEGRHVGDLLVKETLHLSGTASLTGTITTANLTAGEGCSIEGPCTVTGNIDSAATVTQTAPPPPVAEAKQLNGAPAS